MLFRAMRSRNYRLFFLGQVVSLTGSWMTMIATSWLAYRLTGSAAWLGLVGFASQVPASVLSPFAGVYIDRWNRYRLFAVTQLLSMAHAFALAALALAGTITIEQVIWLSIAQGAINAFDIPVRQAFLVEIVERHHLSNAIALNSTVFNAARLIGPSIAGMLIAAAGEGMCFLVDGFSYVASLAALAMMRLPDTRPSPKPARLLEQLREGLAYVYHARSLRAIIVLTALVSIAGVPYAVLMPVFARDVLRGGPHIYGFLMAASGLGALAGAIYLASRRTTVGLGEVIAVAGALFGFGLIGFAYSRLLWTSMAMMFLVGGAILLQMAASNTVIQTVVDEDKRGRVTSLYLMAFMGMMPFGSLLAGALAERVGAPHTLALGGAVCVAGVALFARQLPHLQKAIRPVAPLSPPEGS